MIKELKLKEMINRHINPEVLTFQKSYQLLIKEKKNKIPNGDLVKIFVECFLLHARNLLDFLMDKKYESDAKISDFIDNTEDVKKNVQKAYRDYYIRINKQLSHITWARLDDADQIVFDQPKINEIYKAIIKAIDEFNRYNEPKIYINQLKEMKKAKTIWWIIVIAFVLLLAYNLWQGNYPEFWWSLILAIIVLVVAIIVQKKR